MPNIFLHAQDNISDCIHARNFKLAMKHIWTKPIWRLENMITKFQAHKLVCMHTIFLCAQGHISGCVNAKDFDLGMKHLKSIFK